MASAITVKTATGVVGSLSLPVTTLDGLWRHQSSAVGSLATEKSGVGGSCPRPDGGRLPSAQRAQAPAPRYGAAAAAQATAALDEAAAVAGLAAKAVTEPRHAMSANAMRPFAALRVQEARCLT